MKVQALHQIRYKGESFCSGACFSVDKETAERLLEAGAVVSIDKEVAEYDIDALLGVEDLNLLKVDELKAVCREIGVETAGLNKSKLIEAIESETEEVEEDEADNGEGA